MEGKRKYKYIWKYVEVIGTRDYHNRILSLIPRQMERVKWEMWRQQKRWVKESLSKTYLKFLAYL